MAGSFRVSVSQGSLVRSQLASLSLSSTLQKERRLLQNRRLDLDACKARLKKAKAAEAKATVSAPAPSCSWALLGSPGMGSGRTCVWHALFPWLGLDCAEWPGHGLCPNLRKPWWLQGRLTVPVTGLGAL